MGTCAYVEVGNESNQDIPGRLKELNCLNQSTRWPDFF